VTAEGALESARQASARGRALIETIAREIEAVEEASMRASSSLAAEMRAAITRGSAPSVGANDREMAKSDLARTALDARRQAAEQVVADLAAENASTSVLYRTGSNRYALGDGFVERPPFPNGAMAQRRLP
jgi:prophage DNA circulation protein